MPCTLGNQTMQIQTQEQQAKIHLQKIQPNIPYRCHTFLSCFIHPCLFIFIPVSVSPSLYFSYSFFLSLFFYHFHSYFSSVIYCSRGDPGSKWRQKVQVGAPPVILGPTKKSHIGPNHPRKSHFVIFFRAPVSQPLGIASTLFSSAFALSVFLSPSLYLSLSQLLQFSHVLLQVDQNPPPPPHQLLWIPTNTPSDL